MSDSMTAPDLDALPPFERAIRIAGSEQKLADMTGVSQPAINKAKRRGRTSAELAVAVDKAMAPKVTKEELRPDIFARVEREVA